MTQKPRAYQRFLAELKRRRVLNTAALYGGVAFVIFQSADFVVPALGLSEWVATAIVLVAALGFPIAMTVAWFYDLTVGGIRETRPPAAGELEAIVAQPARRRWPVGIAGVVGVALLFSALGLEIRHLRGEDEPSLSPGTIPGQSLVVLPFLNLLGEGEDYVSEGVTQEILHGLRKIRGLEVTFRTVARLVNPVSANHTRPEPQPTTTSVLEGSLVDDGDTLEMAVHLVPVDDREPHWSRSYRLPKDRFLVALDGAVWEIAGRLGAETSPKGRPPLVEPATSDFSAYRDYLRGRHLARLGTRDALESALDYYNRALLLDPGFGPAWSALSIAYVLLPEAGGPPMMEILPYVRAALDKAMEPGHETADGHAASGYLSWVHLWDFQGAEKDFQTAIALDPLNSVARYWFAEFLATQRRWEEGLEQVDRALALDPLSPAAHMIRGLLLQCGGLEGADLSYRRALELAPDMHPAAYVLAGHLAMEGDLEGALAEFERFSSLTGTDPRVFRTYLAAVSDSTKRQDAVAAFAEAGFYGPVQGAELLAYLGEADAALALLQRAALARSPYLPWINAMPQFAELRKDHRFEELLAWLGSRGSAN